MYNKEINEHTYQYGLDKPYSYKNLVSSLETNVGMWKIII